MSVSLLINCAISVCAFLLTKQLIPSLRDMFIAANLFGNDLCKRDKPKMWVQPMWPFFSDVVVVVVAIITLCVAADHSQCKIITMFALFCIDFQTGGHGCSDRLRVFDSLIPIHTSAIRVQREANQWISTQSGTTLSCNDSVTSYHVLQQWIEHFSTDYFFNCVFSYFFWFFLNHSTANRTDIGAVVDMLHDPVGICRWCFKFAMAP